MKKLIAILMSLNLILSPVVVHAGDEGGYDFYSNQALVVATSIIGSNIITQCPKVFSTPSMITYMSGSLVHIASELLGAKAQNDNHKKKMKDMELLKEQMTNEGGHVQLAALHQQKKDQEDTLDFIEKRKMWMEAITTIYTAAIGFAWYEEAHGTTLAHTAANFICAKDVPAAPACSGVVNPALVAAKASGVLAGTGEAMELFCVKTGPFFDACTAGVLAYLAFAYPGCLPWPADGGAGNVLKVLAYTMAFGLSADGEYAQYGSVLVGLLTVLVPSLQPLVTHAYNYPFPRGVTFAAHALLSGAVVAGLAEREGIAKDNIRKIDDVITNFVLKAGDDGGIDPDADPGNSGGTGSGPEGLTQNLPNGQLEALPHLERNNDICMSRNQQGVVSIGSQNCGSPLRITPPKINMDLSTGTIAAVGNLAAEMANAAASGDVGRANVLASQINAMGANVKKDVKKIKDKYNEHLKKMGQKPVDFDKEVKDKVASMQAAFNKTVADNKIDLAPLKSGDLSLSKEPGKKAEQTNAVPLANKNFIPETPKFDFSSGPEETSTTADAKAATLSESLDNYEVNENDISKKSDVSIFKQLSHRYILNYTKFFERKDVAAPAVPLAPAEANKPK